jgi:TPR repeat protein
MASGDELDAALISSAMNGDTDAQFKVGDYYYDGGGPGKAYEKALPWLQKAAQAGHPEAQARLGVMNEQGWGIAANLPDAIEWYEKAAAQDQRMAQYNLGLIYEYGRGVPRDVNRAIELYTEAAKHPTYVYPQFQIAQIFELGLGGVVDRKKALDWFAEAGKRGYGPAVVRFAALMEKGADSSQELVTALQWFQTAKDGGVDGGAEGVARIEAKLAEVERERVAKERAAAAAHERHARMVAEQEAWSKTPATTEQKKNKPDGAQVRAAVTVPSDVPRTPLDERKPILGKPLPPNGPSIEYKGVKLIGSTYKNANNDEFFKSMETALDMIEALPANLRKYPKLIDEIRYDPPSKERKNATPYANAVGVYSIGPNDAFPAPVVIYQDVRFGAPLYYAFNIATNGYRAASHKRRLDLALRLRRHDLGKARLSASELSQTKQEHDRLLAATLKTNQQVVDELECGPMLYAFELIKVLERDPAPKDAMARRLSARGCF